MAFARHMVCNWSYFAGSMDHVYNGKYSYHVCLSLIHIWLSRSHLVNKNIILSIDFDAESSDMILT